MVSIKDVAKMAGVSPSTVSLVINNSDLVKHETRYKVLQVIEKLHYVPNQTARSLVTKEKKVISMIRISNSAPASLESEHFETSVDTLITDMLPSVQNVLSQNGYSLLTNVFIPLGMPIDKIDILSKSKIDGVIFVGGMIMEEVVEAVKQLEIPAVYAYSRHKNTDFLDTDPEKGMYLATKHLLENGHREIALINGSPLSQTTNEKLLGYRHALEESDIPYQGELVEEADFIGRAGYNAIKKIWGSGKRPTGVVCSCDNVALGVYRYLFDQGLYCPRDVSIIGFEASLLSAHCVPPMTTVCTSKTEIGAEAARILLNRIRNPRAKPVNLIIEPRLIIRDSVSKPAY